MRRIPRSGRGSASPGKAGCHRLGGRDLDAVAARSRRDPRPSIRHRTLCRWGVCQNALAATLSGTRVRFGAPAASLWAARAYCRRESLGERGRRSLTTRISAGRHGDGCAGGGGERQDDRRRAGARGAASVERRPRLPPCFPTSRARANSSPASPNPRLQSRSTLTPWPLMAS